jgi:hypothetical protein
MLTCGTTVLLQHFSEEKEKLDEENVEEKDENVDKREENQKKKKNKKKEKEEAKGTKKKLGTEADTTLNYCSLCGYPGCVRSFFW